MGKQASDQSVVAAKTVWPDKHLDLLLDIQKLTFLS